MQWNTAGIANLPSEITADNANTVLGFNEPDNAGQANISPSVAASCTFVNVPARETSISPQLSQTGSNIFSLSRRKASNLSLPHTRTPVHRTASPGSTSSSETAPDAPSTQSVSRLVIALFCGCEPLTPTFFSLPLVRWYVPERFHTSISCSSIDRRFA